MSEERKFPSREMLQAILDGESRDVRLVKEPPPDGWHDRVMIVAGPDAALTRQLKEAILTIESRSQGTMKILIGPMTGVTNKLTVDIKDLIADVCLPEAVAEPFPERPRSYTPERFQRDWRKIKPGRR